MRLPSSLSLRAALVALTMLLAVPAPSAQEPIKLGIVTFLSGPAAGPFGIPARNAAELTAELLNADKVPAPYKGKGFGGRPVELVIIDEAGGPQKQVSEYRNLVSRVDLVIGYISSGDCLAIAPVAEELKKLTVLFDCGTPRIFEDGTYKYVFRTGPTGTMDNVSMALYLVERLPNVKSIAGLNQNYAWGQDSWSDFEAAMKALKPGHRGQDLADAQADCGTVRCRDHHAAGSGAEVIHSSMWGGDLEGLVLQGGPRGLFQKHKVILSAGEPAINRLGTRIPDGTILGARGPFGPFAPDTELARWLKTAYEDRYQVPPNYASFRMTQAILGVKAAYEKAKGAGNEPPTQDKIIAAFENLDLRRPRRHGEDGVRQGPPGGHGRRRRHNQGGGRSAQDRRHRALSCRKGNPAGRHEERSVDQVGPQEVA